MMGSIRTAFEKGILRWVLVGLMGLLVASFAVWGIGDIFRGRTNTTVATVGDAKLSVMTLQSHFNRELQRLGRSAGRPITPDQARTYGIDRAILAQMMNEATFDQIVERMNLGLSTDSLHALVLANPAFAGPGGQFDPARYAEAMREEGMNEPAFLERQRNEALRRAIGVALTQGIAAPQTYVSLLRRYNEEKRQADFIVLGNAQAGDIPPPAEEALAAYFERRKQAFRAPEYRKIVILSATLNDMMGLVTVPEERINAEYERVKPGLEKRQIRQIRFDSKSEAEEALARLRAGLSFDALAAERKLAASDIDLGLLARPEIVDAAVRDAAFALREGDVSAVIDSVFGPVILTVGTITTAQEAAVKADLRQRLAREAARDEANALANRIDKERGAGLPLADIAARVGILPTIIEAVDAEGKDASGATLVIPGGTDVLQAAFKADVGYDNDPLQPRQAGGYVWYEAAAVTPMRARSLDEVRDSVVAAFIADERRARLGRLATELVAAIKGGKTLSAVGGELGLTVNTTSALTRGKAEGDWSQSAVSMMFATPKGQPGTSPASDLADQIVFVVKDVTDPDMTAPPEPRLAMGLDQAYAGSLIVGFIESEQARLGVSVNQPLFQRATGGGGDSGQ